MGKFFPQEQTRDIDNAELLEEIRALRQSIDALTTEIKAVQADSDEKISVLAKIIKANHKNNFDNLQRMATYLSGLSANLKAAQGDMFKKISALSTVQRKNAEDIAAFEELLKLTVANQIMNHVDR